MIPVFDDEKRRQMVRELRALYANLVPLSELDVQYDDSALGNDVGGPFGGGLTPRQESGGRANNGALDQVCGAPRASADERSSSPASYVRVGSA